MSTFTRSTLLMSILMLVFGNDAQASVATAGVIWPFYAAILLPALSHLLAQITGRYFGFVMLARAMPEIIIFLVVCGSLGAMNGITRLVFLIRHAPRPLAGST